MSLLRNVIFELVIWRDYVKLLNIHGSYKCTFFNEFLQYLVQAGSLLHTLKRSHHGLPLFLASYVLLSACRKWYWSTPCQRITAHLLPLWPGREQYRHNCGTSRCLTQWVRVKLNSLYAVNFSVDKLKHSWISKTISWNFVTIPFCCSSDNIHILL